MDKRRAMLLSVQDDLNSQLITFRYMKLDDENANKTLKQKIEAVKKVLPLLTNWWLWIPEKSLHDVEKTYGELMDYLSTHFDDLKSVGFSPIQVNKFQQFELFFSQFIPRMTNATRKIRQLRALCGFGVVLGFAAAYCGLVS